MLKNALTLGPVAHVDPYGDDEDDDDHHDEDLYKVPINRTAAVTGWAHF